MSKEKKHQKTEPQPQREETPPETQEVQVGPRGELGQATAGDTIKRMWHETHHLLQDVGDKNNPRKQVWTRKAGSPSLKRFAQQLAASGNQVAKDWFAHKKGALDAGRSEKSVARIALEKQATRAAHRKRSQGKGGGKAKTDDTAAVAAAAVTKKAK